MGFSARVDSTSRTIFLRGSEVLAAKIENCLQDRTKLSKTDMLTVLNHQQPPFRAMTEICSSCPSGHGLGRA